MNEVETIKKAIELKRQAIPLIESEIAELQERLFLLNLKDRFEEKAKDGGDPVDSRKLNCIQFILKN